MSYYESGAYFDAAKEFELAYKIKQTTELKQKLLTCYESCVKQKRNIVLNMKL